MATTRTLLLGVVSYCPEVTTIWAKLQASFRYREFNLDFVTFTSYERQVEALFNGFIDVAWNGPMAHVRCQKLAAHHQRRTYSLGMRDADRDFQSLLVKHRNTEKRASLTGASVQTGAHDSIQAYILPFHFLKEQGVDLKTLDVHRWDYDIGKHGDSALGEDEALLGILKQECDVAICSQLQFERFAHKNELSIVQKFPVFDHCQFDCLDTVPKELREGFVSALFDMKMESKKDEEAMKLEGIRKCWVPPREVGYDSLRKALQDEPVVFYPPPIHTVTNHPFNSLRVSVKI